MRMRSLRRGDHSEGWLATAIEEQTAKLPSDTFLWTAVGAIVGALVLFGMNRKNDSVFVGMWAPVLLILGLYNKIVKQQGHD